jgi:hypothetical protein
VIDQKEEEEEEEEERLRKKSSNFTFLFKRPVAQQFGLTSRLGKSKHLWNN